ncbi:MAG: ABC transporter ATP-binding protein [Lentisphaerae bacterium]|nr:ABC transporter ATP-binding protein [Lentisphaerota bacterium]
MNKAIEIVDLSVKFPSRGGFVEALSHINFSVETGQVCAFLGPNGAGKTTTIHVLLGFLAATEGMAKIFGEDVRKSIARQRIGYLAEHPDTYRFLTGREALSITGRLFGMTGRTLQSNVNAILAMLDMTSAANRKISTYSRGMMQRICLGQSLINNPDLIILDEPTGGLDPIGRMNIRKIIGRLRDEGKTIFFSSHELSEAETVCDHLVIISSGNIVVSGAINKLIKPGENLEKYFMKTIQTAAIHD